MIADRIRFAYDSIRALADEAGAIATESPTKENWEACNALNDALHDIWGAFGAAAISEEKEKARSKS